MRRIERLRVATQSARRGLAAQLHALLCAWRQVEVVVTRQEAWRLNRNRLAEAIAAERHAVALRATVDPEVLDVGPKLNRRVGLVRQSLREVAIV